jgi:Tfp pilus assembly protein PilX
MDTLARKKQTDEGSVLVLVLFIAIILSGLGIMILWHSSSGTKITGNIIRRQEAFNAAESGLRRGLRVLGNNLGNWPPLLQGQPCNAPLNPTAALGRVLCDNLAILQNVQIVPTGNPAYPSTANAEEMRYTIWIRNDAAEYAHCDGINSLGETGDIGDCDGDGDNDAVDQTMRQTQDSDERVTLRVRGVSSDGLSSITVESTVSNNTPIITGGINSQAGLDGQGSNSMKNAWVGP